MFNQLFSHPLVRRKSSRRIKQVWLYYGIVQLKSNVFVKFFSDSAIEEGIMEENGVKYEFEVFERSENVGNKYCLEG